MISVLSLTTDEQARLRAAFEQRDANLRAWLDGEEGQALREEEKALREAVESRDLAGVEAVTRKETTQREKFRTLVEQTQEDIFAALPPDKLPDWDGHRIAKRMLELMAPLGLSSEQATAIRSNGRAAVESALNSDRANPLAAGYLELEKWAEANVLNPTQKAAYQGAIKRNPIRSLAF